MATKDEKDEKDQAGVTSPTSSAAPAAAADETPKYDAKADKEYEQRRAGLLPPDAVKDRIVLAGRKAKAEAEKVARAAREAAGRARRRLTERIEAP